MLSGVFSLCVYNRSILALQPANTPYHPSGPYRDLRRTADTRHSYYVCAPAVMVTPAHDDRERTLRLRIRLITPVSHDARYAASGTSVPRSSSTYVHISRIFFSRHASWARVIWSAKSISRVICPPSGIVKSQQSVALSRSLSVSYRRELRAPFALCGSHSARGFVSARAPSSAPCLTTYSNCYHSPGSIE